MYKQELADLLRFCEIDVRFRFSYEGMLDEWGEDNIPLTFLAGSFGQIVTRNWNTFDDPMLLAVFGLAEELMEFHDVGIREIIATGFLETVMNDVASGIVPKVDVYKCLGSISKDYCEAYEHFYNERAP